MISAAVAAFGARELTLALTGGAGPWAGYPAVVGIPVRGCRSCLGSWS